MFFKLFNQDSGYAHTYSRIVIESTHFRGLLNLHSTGGGGRERRASKALFSVRDAILTPEPGIFFIVCTLYISTYLYIRPPRLVTRERRNCDLYLPESAACRDWSINFPARTRGITIPHSDWSHGSSKSCWIVASMASPSSPPSFLLA